MKLRKVQHQHHTALHYSELPDFLARLRGERGTAAEALQFTILTVARAGETIGAAWLEIDFDKAIWTVPGDRMKSKRAHRVPLSKDALIILSARQAGTDGQGYIFGGDQPKKPLSNVAIPALLSHMGWGGITVHGFRSTFRDWVEETTNYAATVAEASLAHVVWVETEAAYQRNDLFERRRELMNAWATFCTTPLSRNGKSRA